MRYPPIKAFAAQTYHIYFYNTLRKIEFSFCITFSIALSFAQTKGLVSTEWRGIIGQVQALMAIYISFRFGYLGMTTAVFFSLWDIIAIPLRYAKTGEFTLIVGLTVRLLSILSSIIIGVLSNKQENHRREFQRLAVTDELTGVHNQRFLHSRLEAEIDSIKKTGGFIGLLLLDIDGFRMYNDLYGRNNGDIILKNTAALLNIILNKNGVVCRFGGDEFAIFFKHKEIGLLEKQVEHIHTCFENLKKDYFEDIISKRITVSMGLSVFPGMSSNKEDLISKAEMALYHAKNSGENSFHFYQDIMLQIQKDIKSDQQQIIGIFKGLLSAISAKDKYTVGHCERVATYAAMIGEALNLDLKEISTLKYAGLLHDIGKIEWPKSLLNKLGRLTDEEYEMIRKHPIYSVNILEPLSEMEQLIDYVKHHHERVDGKGYPDGLSGEMLSLGARILCIADCFDAMVSERPYRKRMTIEEAFIELENNAGTQFDPELVKVFIQAMQEKASIKCNYKIESLYTFSKPATCK